MVAGVEHEARQQAILHAGLNVNNVAKTFLFFRAAQLPQRHVDDVLMQLQGDMSRFDQARALMLRLAHRQGDNTGNSSYYDKDETYGIEEEYERSWHQAPSVLYGDMEYWDHSTAREDYASSSNWYDYDGNWSYHTYEDEEYDYQFDYPEHELYYDDDSAWYEESWNAEENQPPEDGGEKEETFYQGGKGGRTFNLGCSVCGSKWHSASTCPMSKGSSKGQGGYNQGSFKGKNHGRFGKGKGKGKSKGKGKFKGKFHRPYGGKSFRDKGYGRKGYWTSGDSPTTFFRQEQQLRHAREGLQLNLMTQSNDGPQLNEDQAAATPHSHHAVPEQAKATSTGTTENGHDFLRLSRPGKSTQSETSEEPTSASSRKHLNFPVQVNQNCETDAVSSYHMIKGIKRRGLLVDPGAAAGLIGSETLRDLVEECLKPHGLQEQIQWTERRTSVTGISGKGDETLAEVSFQFSLEGDKTGTFTGDVLGGEGSLCPALVSNPSLRSLRAVICSDWFTNGDGLLICPSADDQQTKENTMIRLLLTDSGHYIIPMDKNPPVHEDEQKKAKMFMHTVLNISSQQWSDVHQTNKYCFQVSQMNEMEDNTEDHERNEEDQRPKEHDTTTSPSSSTRSPMSRTYASTRDFWKRVGDQWHRHHVRPRTAIFSPDKGKSPDLLERTQGRRETKICYVNGDEDNIVDTGRFLMHNVISMRRGLVSPSLTSFLKRKQHLKRRRKSTLETEKIISLPMRSLHTMRLISFQSTSPKRSESTLSASTRPFLKSSTASSRGSPSLQRTVSNGHPGTEENDSISRRCAQVAQDCP